MPIIQSNPVDAYLNAFPKEIQERMEILRVTIQKAAPKAQEVISYKMPAYKLNGILVYFAGYKNHIGFYPTPGVLEFYKKELKDFKTSKGAVQFPNDKALPLALITKIVKYRVKEDKEKATEKVKK